MVKYKYLMFDLDDTLIDNKENVRYAFKIMEKVMNRKYDAKNFERWYEIDRKFWHDRQDGLVIVPDEYKEEESKKSKKFLDWIRAQRVLIYYNNSITLEKAIELNNIFMEALKKKVVTIDGVLEVLEYLSSKYTLLVVTNGPLVAAVDKVKKTGGLKYIERIFASEMAGYMKPDKRYFDYIVSELGSTNMEEYLMIGDSLKSDVLFGMNCGFDTCFINNRDKEIGDYKPTMVINNIKDLKKEL